MLFKVQLARRQLVGLRGLPEGVGQVVEPLLVPIPEVEQGAHRIVPALPSGAPVTRPAELAAPTPG